MAETVNLDALVAADGARSCPARAGSSEKGHGRSSAATCLRMNDGDVSRKVAFKERVRLTLLKLVAADRQGVTPHDVPVGARLADYVWKLRAARIPIETDVETRGGEFPGVPARCRLAPAVHIREALSR